jgi:hypothetical protein
MTSPQPDQLTYAEALAAVAAARAAVVPAETITATTAQLAESVIAVREQSTQWAVNIIGRLFRGVDVYDGEQVQAFAEQAAVHMVSAQTATARTAAAAQAQILSTMGVRVPRPTPSNPTDVRGTPSIDEDGAATVEQGRARVDYAAEDRPVIVDLDEDATTVGMFNRPARTQRYLESIGKGSVEARVAAEDRLSLLVGDNVMLAQRLAEAEIIAQAAAVDDRVTGMRRVIHPELSRTGVCGLCIAAADRLCSVRELAPVHGRCKCTVAAVTEEFDPADELNTADIGALYGLAGGTSGAQLKRTRYQVDEHGELGPVLVPAPRKPRTSPQPTPRRRAQRQRVSR